MNKHDVDVGNPKSIGAGDSHCTSERKIGNALLLNLQLNVQTRLIQKLRTTVECQKEVVSTLNEELELLQEQLEIQEFQNRKLQKDVGLLRTLVYDRHPRPIRDTLLPHEASASSSISSNSTLEEAAHNKNDDLFVVMALMKRLSILHYDKPASHHPHRCASSSNNTHHIGTSSPVNIDKGTFNNDASAFAVDKPPQRSFVLGKMPPSASGKEKGPTELSQILTEAILGRTFNFANDDDQHDNDSLLPRDSIKLSKKQISARKKMRAVDTTITSDDNTMIPLSSLAAEVCSLMSRSIQKYN